ncbi:MAG: ABC transporter permease [Butyricimonas faecihominis]
MYHLKLVGRQIFQRKGYFVINTIGLAVALTASVFIYTFLVKEWQTNTFHENVDHIYRITVQTDGNTHWGAEVCSSLGEIAKAELPEVADYTRIITAREMKIRWENDDHYQTGISCGYADRQLFSMFTFPLVTGSIQAFEHPGWVVISESIARRHFKNTNPIGKLVYLENLYTSGSISTFRIAGVMKDMPPRSSIQADVILDFSVIEHSFRYNMGNAVQTFIQLTDGADVQKVEEQLLQIEYRESDYIREQKELLQLQPLRKMYLHSDHIQDFDLSFAQGSGTFNWILFGILLLILSLAFCNYSSSN